ncbi:MAG: hypothetical protein HY847_10670 [Betaproteobacteria bacterium]|nr:hypothetical protein [Betaproteobacteria bacterium]
MNSFNQILRHIRWNLALIALLSLLGAAAVYASIGLHAAAQKADKQAVAKRTEIQGKLANAQNEEQELREKFARYQSIEARGYIGGEKRLDWVEQMRKIKTNRKLLDVQYELQPQKVLEPNNSGYDFMVSNMRLQMQLLHEEDLLNFLADLRDNIRAYTNVKSCNVTRQTILGSTAQLVADCSIDWITLRERSFVQP